MKNFLTITENDVNNFIDYYWGKAPINDNMIKT